MEDVDLAGLELSIPGLRVTEDPAVKEQEPPKKVSKWKVYKTSVRFINLAKAGASQHGKEQCSDQRNREQEHSETKEAPPVAQVDDQSEKPTPEIRLSSPATSPPSSPLLDPLGFANSTRRNSRRGSTIGAPSSPRTSRRNSTSKRAAKANWKSLRNTIQVVNAFKRKDPVEEDPPHKIDTLPSSFSALYSTGVIQPTAIMQ